MIGSGSRLISQCKQSLCAAVAQQNYLPAWFESAFTVTLNFVIEPKRASDSGTQHFCLKIFGFVMSLVHQSESACPDVSASS